MPTEKIKVTPEITFTDPGGQAVHATDLRLELTRDESGVTEVRIVFELTAEQYRAVDEAELFHLVRTMRADARTCIIGLTHDPKLDDLALMEALESPAFYVGAIGSRRNTALRLQRLSEHFGLGDAQLARLRGPIGLYIGSKTPPEIAVSIMAEVLAAKNGVALPRGMTVEEGKLAAAQPPQPLEDDGPEGITPLVCVVG